MLRRSSGTPSRLSGLLAGLALTLLLPGGARAQLGQTSLSTEGGGDAGATPTAFEFVDRGSRALPKAGTFLPALDTPRFENRGIGEDSGGICYGMALVTMDWYRRVVYPLESQSFLNFAGWGEGAAVEGILGEDEEIRLENLADYRLGSYTRDRERSVNVARHAIQFHDDQFVVPRTCREDCDAASKQELVDEYLNDAEWSSALVGIYSADDSAGHALVVHGARRGVARDASGNEVPAIKYEVYDPNFSEARRDTPDTYLLYFPEEEKWGVPASFESLYGSLTWQEGAYLEDSQLLVHRPDHLLSGTFRDIQNWWEDDRSQNYTTPLIEGVFDLDVWSPDARAE